MQKTLALALVTLALAVPAAAHGRDDRRDHDRQDRRDTAVVVVSADVVAEVEADIRRGVQRGSLTHREAEHLRAEVRDFEQLRRRALRDGRVSHGEENQLARAAERLEGQLRRQLHDDDRRGRYDERGHWERDARDQRSDDRRDHGPGGYDARPVVAVNGHGHGC